MSSYRDDYLDIAYISDQTWMITKSNVEDISYITSDLKHGIRVFHSDELVISDFIQDHYFAAFFDNLLIQDSFVDKKIALSGINETLNLSFSINDRLIRREFIEDNLLITDEILDKNKSLITDYLLTVDQYNTRKLSTQFVSEKNTLTDFINGRLFAKSVIDDELSITSSFNEKLYSKSNDWLNIQDEWTGRKIHQDLIEDKLILSTNVVKKVIDKFEDLLSFGEIYSGRLIVKEQIHDNLTIQDEFTSPKPTQSYLESHSIISDSYIDHLFAKQWIFDSAFIEDVIFKGQGHGGAWTANVDNWAMSRYEDYNFTELCIIDNKLYGVNDSGVFSIDSNEYVQGKINTGKLDLGQEKLVHPIGAYLEYELSGISKQIEVGVSTTQSGNEHTYFYKLPQEQSNQLTNGRVIFGRGLRGRHFAFEFKISGDHGYINDLNIDIAATKRRV